MFKVRCGGSAVRAAIVVALAGGVGAAGAGASVQVDPRLEARAAGQTDVLLPVIVELNELARPETTLSAPQRAAQRARISDAGDRVARLARDGSRRKGSSDRVLETLPFVGTTVDAQGLEALKASSDVKAVYLSELKRPALAQSAAMVGAPTVWANGYTGAGQTVAIIDTGVDNNHPWFGNGKIVDQACFSRSEDLFLATLRATCPGATAGPKYGAGAAQPPSSGWGRTAEQWASAFDHGTHVAGIAAGKNPGGVGGVAPDAKILAVNASSANVFNGAFEARFDNRDLLAALDWVNQQRTRFRIAAVNLSLGSGAYTADCDAQLTASSEAAVRDAVNALWTNGIAVVASSGNSGSKTTIGSPACIAKATSVGAVDDVTGKVAGFSQSSASLDVLAPGVNIASAQLGSTGTTSKSGTSMAAPHVAGAIALFTQKNPALNGSWGEAAIRANGVPTTDVNGVTKPRLQISGVLGLAPFAPPVGPPEPVSTCTASLYYTRPTGQIVVKANVMCGEVATSMRAQVTLTSPSGITQTGSSVTFPSDGVTRSATGPTMTWEAGTWKGCVTIWQGTEKRVSTCTNYADTVAPGGCC